MAESVIGNFVEFLQALGCGDVEALDRVLRERTGEPSVRTLPPSRPEVERVSIFVGSSLGQVDFPFTAREFWKCVGTTVERFEHDRKWDAYHGAAIALLDAEGREWWRCDASGRKSSADEPVVPEFVLTAHNPAGVVASAEYNARGNERLAEELRSRGLEFVHAICGEWTVDGWGHCEASFAFDAARDEAVELAAAFGQDALFRIRPRCIEVIEASTGRIARVRYDPVVEIDDDGEDGCDACDGIEDLMVENAQCGEGPYESMGYVFGYADTCEMCDRSIDTDPAFEAYERHMRDIENDDLQAALSEESTSPTALTELGASDDVSVRRAVASNTSTPADTLHRLYEQDADRAVREAVVRNPSTPLDTLRAVNIDAPTWVPEALAANRSTPPEVLVALANDPRAALARPALAAHPNMPTEQVLALLEKGGVELAKIVAAGEHTNPEVLRRLAAHDDSDVRWTVAHAGRHAPDDVVARLAEDPEALVRLGVGYRKGLPASIAARLSQDEDAGVRQKAAWLVL